VILKTTPSYVGHVHGVYGITHHFSRLEAH